MLTMPYGTESKSRNADFILIARKGDTTTLGPKGRCPLSEAMQPFDTTCGASRILFFICGAAATAPFEPSEPSRQRRRFF